MIKYRMTLFFLFILTGVISAQSTTNSCIKSTEGKDFWFGFMESRHHQTGHYLEITMTSTFVCRFSIYFGKSTTPSLTGSLQPNTPIRWQPSWTLVEPIGSETIEQKAIHIVSDQPMNIFALNWSPNSADAAVIFPIEALGNEHYAMCYEPHVNEGTGGTPGNGKNSEFLVVAAEDNTKITIIPTKVTDQLRPANVPFSVTLNKGELYQVQSMNHANLTGQGDLTGSYIKSDKPIAFYSGAWSTTIPASSTSAYDHLYEQIPPVRSWGRKFVTVPLKGRSTDVFRILASENKTVIHIGTNTPVVLDKGNFYEFMLSQDHPSLIESDHPILLAQYMVSNSVDKPANASSWDGDPLMLIVSPVDQTREAVTFVAYDTPEIVSKFFVNVVTKTESIYDILLDGQPISFQALSNSEYSYAQIAIAKGNHNLNSLTSGKGFIAYVYGYGGVESYGYGVGFNLSVKLDLGGDLHFISDTVLLCKGQAKLLDAGSFFSKFLWSTGDTTQTIFVTKPGYSKVTASTTDGCVLTDSIYTYVSNPVVSLGNDTTLCSSKTLKLDAGSGFVTYKWNTKDSLRTITVETQGMYGVLATNKYECQSSDSVYVFFVDNPKLNLGKLDTLICGGKVTTFNIAADKGKYQLKSDNPLVTINGLTATVPLYGKYPFTFIATDPYTCVSDTFFSAGFREIPKLNLGNDTTICNPQSIILDAGGNLASYLWNTKDTVRTINVKIPGNYSVFIRNKYGCSNQDNIFVNFVNVPKLDLSKLDTLNCGVKTTTANISVDKGKYFLSSSDPSITIQGLTATVPKFGTFPFNFKSTDQFACASDTNFTIGFHKIPTVSISVDDTTCYGYSLDAKYIGDADANVARFTWVFAKDTIANEIGRIQMHVKLGLDRTKRDLYLYVTERGCQNSQAIKEINVIPDLNFSVLDSIKCQPLKFDFTATNTEVVVDYFWDWGDGISGHNGKTTSHSYTKDGFYSVQVTATTDKNCVNTVKKENILYVAPVPTVDFSIKENKCLDIGPQTLSYTGSADDKDHYNWDLTSFMPNELIKIPGDSKGPFVFDLIEKPKAEIKLQVTSKYGCISENKSLVLLRIPKFSLQVKDSAGCIPFDVNFSALTTDKVDQVDYKWNLGDGNAGYGQNVTHTYPLPDRSYNITLFADSKTTGCMDTLYKPGFITVYPQPKASFTVNEKILSNENPVAGFTNHSEGADHYFWEFDDGLISRLKDPIHKYEVVGPRRVLLESINEFGCSDTISEEVVISLLKIYVPNAFSPFAPNPVDREFFPYCNGVLQKGYHLKIVSRWNEVIFETKNELKGWNGRLSNGSVAPVGNYVWFLYYEDFLGKFHNQNGTVALFL